MSCPTVIEEAIENCMQPAHGGHIQPLGLNPAQLPDNVMQLSNTLFATNNAHFLGHSVHRYSPALLWLSQQHIITYVFQLE